MKSTTFNRFITITLLAFLAFAPLQFSFADNGDDNKGFFSTFRERQISNREQVKVNLLQILSSDETETPQVEPVTAEPAYTATELANITYQLTDIADRIESRMLILENQGTILSDQSYTALALVRTKLESVTLQLMINDSINVEKLTDELASVRTDLQNIISELKIILTPTN